MEEVKNITQEAIDYFAANIEVPRDLVYVNLPTEKEKQDLAKTKSGLFLKEGQNEFLYTVVAKGNQVSDLEVGDKVYLKVKMLDKQMIDEHVFATVSPFQIIAKRK